MHQEELLALSRQQAQYAFNSEKYLYDVLKFKCVNWQSQACNDYDTHGHCAWSTGSGVGKCLVYGQDILLSSGHYLPAQWFIGKEISILTFDNTGKQKVSIAQVFDNGLRECLKLTSKTGREISCTKNHPLLTVQGWRQVSELKVGDRVAIPVKLETINSTISSTIIDDNELKIIAYLLGDGCITASTPRFTQRANAQYEEFKQLVEYFGDVVTFVSKRSAASDYRVVGGNVRTILTKHLLDRENSHEKEIPLTIFGLSDKQVALFLNRLFSTDGSIEKHTSRGKNRAVISYCSCSKKLIIGVQRLLLRFKILAYLRYKKNVNAYELVITDAESLLLFCVCIGIIGRDEDIKFVIQYVENLKSVGIKGTDLYDLSVSAYILERLRVTGKSQTVNGMRYCVKINRNPSKDTVKFYAKHLNDDYLRFITSDIFGWDEIESIEGLGNQLTVGVTVPETECYITDFMEHNTALLARLAIHFLNTRDFPVIPCTAPTQKQLFNVLWAEAGRAMAQSPMVSSLFEWQQERIFLKGQKDKWFATAIVSAPPKPGAMTTESLQGFHAENLLFIVDEASGIPDQVMGAADGAMSTPSARAILASNPTRNTGYFYRATMLPELSDLWARIFVDAEKVNAPYIDKPYIQRLKKIYGENSDYFRMRVRGLPPRTETNALVSPEQVFAAHCKVDAAKDGKRVGSCDPARFGDDDTVIYVRDGKVILNRFDAHGMDTVRVGRLCVEVIKEFDLSEMRVDCIGIGAGVVDWLNDNVSKLIKDCKCSIISIHVGEDAISKTEFFNRRAEIAWQIRVLIDEIYIPFPTPLLDEELVAVHYGWDSKDKRIKLESKDDIKKNLSPRRSPNDFDALCLVCADLEASTTVVDKLYFLMGQKHLTLAEALNTVNRVNSDENIPSDLVDTLTLSNSDNSGAVVNKNNVVDLASFLGKRNVGVGINRFSEFKRDFTDFSGLN
jgi:intein/homing endonuclease